MGQANIETGTESQQQLFTSVRSLWLVGMKGGSMDQVAAQQTPPCNPEIASELSRMNSNIKLNHREIVAKLDMKDDKIQKHWTA